MINYISVFDAVQIASSEVFLAVFVPFLSTLLIYCDDCNLPAGNYPGLLVVAEGSNTDWHQSDGLTE